jgi:hypothetical protein
MTVYTKILTPSGGNVLAGWRRIPAILDAQQQATARCIGKGNAILGDFAPVCRLAGHCPQGLLVEESCPSKLKCWLLRFFSSVLASRVVIGTTRTNPFVHLGNFEFP